MALPTTGLTIHINAATTTDLWTVNVGGVFSVHPIDTGVSTYLDDVAHGANSFGTIAGPAPTWQSAATPMLLPSVKFNGSTNYVTLVRSSDEVHQNIGNLITQTAATMVLAVYVSGGSTNNSASYENDAILASNDGNTSIYIKNNSGAFSIGYGNYTGSDDHVEKSISVNTTYIVMVRHESGSIYISINGGAETSVSSGSTQAAGGDLLLGKNYSSAYFNGYLGELATWNVALTGTDLTDAISYFTGRWAASSTLSISATDTITFTDTPIETLRSFVNISDASTVSESVTEYIASKRFYLPITAAATPGFVPTPNANWEDTTAIVRLVTKPNKISDTLATKAFTDSNAVDRDILFIQAISQPLRAGTVITGAQAIKAQVRGVESNAGNNMFLTFGIRVIAANGITVQKIVLAVTRDDVEFTTSLTNRQFTATTNATDYPVIAGDRLVFEVGTGGDPGGGQSHGSSLRLGDSAATDLPEDDSTTTDLNPWIEFASDIFVFEITTYSISVSDTATLTDTPTERLTFITPSTSDTATITDTPNAIIANHVFSVIDTTTITDTPSSVASDTDIITVTDALTVLPIVLPINVSDTTTVTETFTVKVPILTINVTEGANVGVVIVFGLVIGDFQINVTDMFLVSDSTITSVPQLTITLNDTITLTETLSDFIDVFFIELSDSVSVTVTPALTNSIFVSVGDTIIISETNPVTITILKLSAAQVVSVNAQIGQIQIPGVTPSGGGTRRRRRNNRRTVLEVLELDDK